MMPRPKLLTEPVEHKPEPETKDQTCMRRFHFLRITDASGVSGTGVVAEGIEFTNGTVVVSWLTKHRSLAIYDNIKEAELVHGHNGATKLVFHDD
jgi:hypothetical protein